MSEPQKPKNKVSKKKAGKMIDFDPSSTLVELQFDADLGPPWLALPECVVARPRGHPPRGPPAFGRPPAVRLSPFPLTRGTVVSSVLGVPPPLQGVRRRWDPPMQVAQVRLESNSSRTRHEQVFDQTPFFRAFLD